MGFEVITPGQGNGALLGQRPVNGQGLVPDRPARFPTLRTRSLACPPRGAPSDGLLRLGAFPVSQGRYL